jgi:hypothetical protein
MARLGILKPLRGTSSSLANIVLQEGEIAFEYPSTGPGTGLGNIKMGDGSTVFSNLPYCITGGTSEWEYDTGTDEAALLHNLEHPELEQIGKIYYIQSYMNAGTKYSTGTSIQQNIPYKVIGINHEGTINTIDLMSCVAVNYYTFHDNYNTWSRGRYTYSNFYNWIGSTCQGGYSSNIQDKMINMTERWREATGNTSGTLQSRSTKVKLLNPFELFGSSITSYDYGYGKVSDFTQYNYGSHYSGVFPNSTSADTSRVRYHNTDMSQSCNIWTNSYYAFDSEYNVAHCFYLHDSGSCSVGNVRSGWGIAPVIRLYSHWEEYDEGNDEAALLNNIKHPEHEQLGKIYYIQSYMNAGTKYKEGTPTIQQNIPYKVIGVNHEGTTNTVDLQAMVAVNYIQWNSSYNSWSYGKYTSSGLYNWIGSTCQNGYSSNIQAKMVNMTERWREATGNSSGTLQSRSTKVKLLNPFELFGSSSASYDGEVGTVSDFTQYNYGSHYSGVFPNTNTADNSRVRYHNTAMSDTCYCWTNSWYAFNSSYGNAYCFAVFGYSGACYHNYLRDAFGVSPVIRLSDNPS